MRSRQSCEESAFADGDLVAVIIWQEPAAVRAMREVVGTFHVPSAGSSREQERAAERSLPASLSKEQAHSMFRQLDRIERG